MKPLGKLARLGAAVGVALVAGPTTATATDIVVTGAFVAVAGTAPDGRPRQGPAAIESGEEQVLLTVCNTHHHQAAWRVDVRTADGEWPRGLKLWMRRTGDGVGPGAIVGRRRYVEIGSTYRTLCTGTGDRGNIPFQLKLEEEPFTVEPGTHSTTLLYTVVEIGG